MTFKNFASIFSNNGSVAIKEIKGKRVAIDASIKIAAALVSMQYGTRLTAPDGSPTSHIKILLNNIAEFKRHNISQIWIFDNSSRKSYKINEISKRTLIRKKIREQIQALQLKIKSLTDEFKDSSVDQNTERTGYILGIDTPPGSDDEFDESDNKGLSQVNRDKLIIRYEQEIIKLKSRDISDFARGIQDLKFMLTMLNIPFIVAPKETEAEQIGALLANNNIIDYFITTDPDYLLFAAGWRIQAGVASTFPVAMLKKIPKKQQYHVYMLDTILAEHLITEKELLNVGVCMGVDVINHDSYSSTSGIKGIGVKNVINIVKGIRSSKAYVIEDYHIAGIQIFKTGIDINAIDLPGAKRPISAANLKQFKAWIIKEKRFNEDNVKKILKIITSSKV